MQKKQQQNLIPQESIQDKIIVLRGKKVMIDRDLAMLYGVPTKVLNQAVKRNLERFPANFCFSLNKTEKDELVTNCDRFNSLKHSTVLPFAFTEYGVAMLSSVLNSKQAIQINIAIINTFVKMREMFDDFNNTRKTIEEMKKNNDERFVLCYKILDAHSKDIKTIYKLLSSPEEFERDEIGFRG